MHYTISLVLFSSYWGHVAFQVCYVDSCIVNLVIQRLALFPQVTIQIIRKFLLLAILRCLFCQSYPSKSCCARTQRRALCIIPRYCASELSAGYSYLTSNFQFAHWPPWLIYFSLACFDNADCYFTSRLAQAWKCPRWQPLVAMAPLPWRVRRRRSPSSRAVRVLRPRRPGMLGTETGFSWTYVDYHVMSFVINVPT